MTTLTNGIRLPESFLDTISRGFQQKGKHWLGELPDLVDRCAARWHLTDLHLPDELSYNLVLFARQPEYGEVALKIGVPHTDLFSEMRSIQLFQGHGFCRCFDSDETLGAMLLERILPGETLWSVNDRRVRYQITADFYRQMNVQPPAHHILPLFGDLISNAIQRASTVPETPTILIEKLHQAQSDYAALEAESGSPVVLHCDLHHGNILRDERVWEASLGWRVSPGWRVIDPKGFVGARAIECARFIENEIDSIAMEDKMQALDRMFTIFAEALEYPKRTLAQALVIDNILSTFWSVEDHSPQEWIEAGLMYGRMFEEYRDGC